MLGACSVQPDRLWQQMDAGATILCTHNKDVRKHNATALEWHQRHGHVRGQQVHRVAMRHDALAAGPVGARAAKAWLKRPHFH